MVVEKALSFNIHLNPKVYIKCIIMYYFKNYKFNSESKYVIIFPKDFHERF
jgi:hypothetical protein